MHYLVARLTTSTLLFREGLEEAQAHRQGTLSALRLLAAPIAAAAGGIRVLVCLHLHSVWEHSDGRYGRFIYLAQQDNLLRI